LRTPPDLATLRAAWWAEQALRSARRALARGEIRDIQLPVPPRLPLSAGRGVDAVIRRRRPTCIEVALIRQRWLAAHGRPRAIAVGVTAPSDGFAAHAWLVGDDEPAVSVFHELTRLEP
jgi:hypothetical protein